MLTSSLPIIKVKSVLDLTIIVSIMDFLAYGITKSVIGEEGEKKAPVSEEPTYNNQSCSRRPRFRFSLIGVKPGDYISLEGNDSLKFKVLDDERVEYKGEPWKLSPLAEKLLTNRKPPLQGPRYFKFNGEILDDIRMK